MCSSNDIDGLSKTIQDSSVYPILVKPWTVNKVTCGSLLTFLDAATPDVTVSFDACLVALILLNLFIFGPLLWADVGDKFSNIFFSFQDRIDRIENAYLIKYSNKKAGRLDYFWTLKIGSEN